MSIYYVSGIPYSSDELYHHGVKGQKWGVRRSREELGYRESGHLRSTSKYLVKQHSKMMKKSGRYTEKANKAKSKGKDPSKYVEKAKMYLNNAKTYQKMNERYNSLSKRQQRKIDRGVAFRKFIGFSDRLDGGTYRDYRNSSLAIDARLRKRLA